MANVSKTVFRDIGDGELVWCLPSRESLEDLAADSVGR